MIVSGEQPGWERVWERMDTRICMAESLPTVYISLTLNTVFSLFQVSHLLSQQHCNEEVIPSKDRLLLLFSAKSY